MNRGSIVRMPRIRDIDPDGESWMEYSTTDKKRVFVAVILGTEPKKITGDDDPAALNRHAVLRELGWAPETERNEARDLVRRLLSGDPDAHKAAEEAAQNW